MVFPGCVLVGARGLCGVGRGGVGVEKIPYQKPSSRISVTEQRPESTSKGPDQHRRNSVKDDPGSTLWINGRLGRSVRLGWGFLSGFL